MTIEVIILVIPGINYKTISQYITVPRGNTLLDLLKTIDEIYGISLIENNNVILLMDGKSIDVDKDLNRDISGNSKLMVMPMISGG